MLFFHRFYILFTWISPNLICWIDNRPIACICVTFTNWSVVRHLDFNVLLVLNFWLITRVVVVFTVYAVFIVNLLVFFLRVLGISSLSWNNCSLGLKFFFWINRVKKIRCNYRLLCRCWLTWLWWCCFYNFSLLYLVHAHHDDLLLLNGCKNFRSFFILHALHYNHLLLFRWSSCFW